ncbi:MAG: nucleotidyltransferase domain-containing protein [Candidatus Omnitrophica bacterium]|nr:nucleotidyltransferase domain-containing protein [Candidatus Omnitrophota bacterium]
MFNPYLISTNHQKVLRFFVLHQEQSFYEREIARKAGLSTSSTHYVLARLYRASVINRKQNGRMYFYSVDKTNPYLKEFKVLTNLLLIEPLVEELKGLSHKIVLFGSWAEGSDNEDSDIDLFIVSSEKEKILSVVNKFSYSAKLYNRKVQPIINAPEELLKRGKEERVFFEQIEKGKVLWEREVDNDIL